MAVIRVDHPDVETFIRAKNNSTDLTQFNMSVGVTDEFMAAVKADGDFDLKFDGQVFKTVSAVALWDDILRSTWDWAEPGILFIDRINQKNNLHYCEKIAATNPCGEQPLPPNGACLLGSFNLVKYVTEVPEFKSVKGKSGSTRFDFDYAQLEADIPKVVRAMDNVVDRAVYPLPAQEKEAKDKRRMGLGVTGVANAIEALGCPYGTQGFMDELELIMSTIRDGCYNASIALAREKGPFPLFKVQFLYSAFAETLPDYIRNDISRYGIRNSHLLSVAPTGTISLSADNVSSGIEPVFSHYYDRTIQTFDGPRVERIEDYGVREFGVKGETADELSVFDHVRVLNLASQYVDSACSKTCNVGDEVTWEQFKDVYMQAYDGGSSGATTFRSSGKRFGILNASTSEDAVETPKAERVSDFIDEKEGGACYHDPATGQRTCE